MKNIFLFLLVVTLANGVHSQESPGISKDKRICNCFYGNEEEYHFEFPDDCKLKDSLFIFIPDTAYFHEEGFKYSMFNTYNDILAFLTKHQFSGKLLAYYDKDQQHPALELNLLNGKMNGTMEAWSFEGETMIERYFFRGSLLSNEKDIGNINWFYNRENNELKIDSSYLQNKKISIFYSADMNQQQLIDGEVKPEEVFAQMKPLKVNGELFSGCLFYYGYHEGFTPSPTAKFNFINGLLDGKTTFYGDYVYVENDDYPEQYDDWVVTEELNYSKGIRISAPDSLDDRFLYKGDRFMIIDNEMVYNEFELAFDIVGNTVQETGRFGLKESFPYQYYITGGEKRNDTLELEMVAVLDARMSTVEDALAHGKRYKTRFLFSGNTLKYIGVSNSRGCENCPPGLILYKYDVDETDFLVFLRPY